MVGTVGGPAQSQKLQLTEVQARILCVGADNGRTPGSSWNEAGQPVNLIRYQHAFESCGVQVSNGYGGVKVIGEGQLIGPTSGWTPQFTSNTANDGKGVPPDGSGLDLNTWVGYFNSILDSRKYCAAFGFQPAPTWRYMRVCTIDPCAKFGLWVLKWLDAADAEANKFYVAWPEELVEETIVKRAYCDRKDPKSGAAVRDWYQQQLNAETGELEWVPAEQPTWQPSVNAEPVPIPNDCWIPCTQKFEDWRVEGAESPCITQIIEACDFLEDGTQVELRIFITDCDGVRVREVYTADQVINSTDPLDPDGDQYEIQGELKNCDGTAFEEPPIAEPDDKEQTLVDCPDPCANGSTYVNGRPPASNAWAWGPYAGDNLTEFEAALVAAGYTIEKFGEKHQICPPFGAFGEDANAILTNGIGDGFVPPVEPNINPDFVPENQCAALTIGKNDDRRDNLLQTNNELLQCLKDLWTKDPLADDDDADLCDFNVQFKSSGLDTLVTDKGTITINPPDNDGFDTNGVDASTWAGAQAQIQAFLDANGGGTVTLSYPSDSILDITITGTSCMFETADDNSNPGPHEFTKTGDGDLGEPEPHATETNPFDPDRGQRWDAWIAQGDGSYTIQSAGGAGSEGWINTWANGNDQQVGVAYFALARIALYDGPPNSGANEKSDGYILIAPNQLTGNGGNPSTAVYDPTISPVFSSGNVTCTSEQMLGLLIDQGFTQSEATELVTTGTTQGLTPPTNGQCWSNGDFVSGQPFGVWGVGA